MKKIVLAGCMTAVLSFLPSLGVAQDKKPEASPHTFTGNVALVSEYRYRGIAQTNSKPAVQGGFDYSHASGFYVGTWGSNVSWLSDLGGVSSSLELDLYGGYKGSMGDFTYDVGGLYYYYPGTYPANFTSPNTFEIYGAVGWKWFTLKYSHSLTNTFGFIDSKGAGYLDLTGTFELGEGFNLVGHIGHQSIPASSPNGRAKSDCSYTDYKIGVTKDLVGLTWGLSYIDTDAKGGTAQCYRNAFNKDVGRGTVVLSVGKTF